MAYFHWPVGGGGQDCASNSVSSSTPHNNHYSDLADVDGGAGRSSLRSASPLHSPPCSSPAKVRMKLDSAAADTGVSPEISPAIEHTELQSPIARFLTSNQPVLDTQLKEMLLSLHRSLHADFTNITYKFSKELCMMGDRVNQVEHAITDITTTVNYIIDANEESEEERQWMRAKIADLEDHFRRNNMKIRVYLKLCLPKTSRNMPQSSFIYLCQN